MTTDNPPPSFGDLISEGAAKLRDQYMGAVAQVAADALRLADGDTSRVDTVTRWPPHAIMETHVTVDGKPFGPVVRLIVVGGTRALVTVEYAGPDQ